MREYEAGPPVNFRVRDLYAKGVAGLVVAGAGTARAVQAAASERAVMSNWNMMRQLKNCLSSLEMMVVDPE